MRTQLDIDAVARLRAVVKEAGSQTAAAQRLKIAPAYISDLLYRRRRMSDAMLEKLGLRRTVIEK